MTKINLSLNNDQIIYAFEKAGDYNSLPENKRKEYFSCNFFKDDMPFLKLGEKIDDYSEYSEYRLEVVPCWADFREQISINDWADVAWDYYGAEDETLPPKNLLKADVKLVVCEWDSKSETGFAESYSYIIKTKL